MGVEAQLIVEMEAELRNRRGIAGVEAELREWKRNHGKGSGMVGLGAESCDWERNCGTGSGNAKAEVEMTNKRKAVK